MAHVDQELEKVIADQAVVIQLQAETISRLAAILQEKGAQPQPATKLLLNIGGKMGQVTLSVDVQNQVVSSQWADDKGDTEGVEAPAGATIQYTSSDPTVVTVDPSTGALTFNREGQATLTATAQDASGATVTSVAPGTVDLVLQPGAASELLVSVGDAQPVSVTAGAPAPSGTSDTGTTAAGGTTTTAGGGGTSTDQPTGTTDQPLPGETAPGGGGITGPEVSGATAPPGQARTAHEGGEGMIP